MPASKESLARIAHYGHSDLPSKGAREHADICIAGQAVDYSVASAVAQAIGGCRLCRLRSDGKCAPGRRFPAKDDSQSFLEFVLNRQDFFADPAWGLRPRSEAEAGFTFGPQIGLTGKDPFDSAEPVKPYGMVMATCVMCHNLPGVYPVNSIANLFSNRTLQDPRTLGFPVPPRNRKRLAGSKLDTTSTNLEPRPKCLAAAPNKNPRSTR